VSRNDNLLPQRGGRIVSQGKRRILKVMSFETAGERGGGDQKRKMCNSGKATNGEKADPKTKGGSEWKRMFSCG